MNGPRIVIFLAALAVTACAPIGDQLAPAVEGARPHIVVVLADDMGWADVGYHGSEIQTPNLDKLAMSGVRLEGFYAQPLCTPTRASLMTGRYPFRYGLQVRVVHGWGEFAVPLEERLLPEALQEAGYRTAIVGKWHLGHARPEHLPTRRGFDHQYGPYLGWVDYWTHETRSGGLDWHRDDQPVREQGYATELIAREAVRLIEEHPVSRPLFLYVSFTAPHFPIQAPSSYIERYRHIEDPTRRIYAAMVSAMDEGVGQIWKALEERGMADRTLLFFSSDNGGGAGARNVPLRGSKNTLYEGGVRVPAFVRWDGVLPAGAVVEAPLHMVDMYPTLLRRAGASREQTLPLDGLDAWATIAEGSPSPHGEIIHQIEPNRGALRRDGWKLVLNGPSPEGATPEGRRIELFHVATDPNEERDLAEERPEVVRALLDRLETYSAEAAPPQVRWEDRTPEGFREPEVWGPIPEVPEESPLIWPAVEIRSPEHAQSFEEGETVILTAEATAYRGESVRRVDAASRPNRQYEAPSHPVLRSTTSTQVASHLGRRPNTQLLLHRW